MEYRLLGRTGVKVSPICLGSGDFGLYTPPDVAAKIIIRGVDAGINLIDTGNSYGDSEKIIGKTLKENKLRHQVLINTKVDHSLTPPLAPNVQGNSRLNIIRACELSLIDLQTDYIDILMVHRYYPEYHIEETLGALTDLVRQGKVRYAGCSTFPPWVVMKAIMLSEMKNYARFVTEESPYNLLDRRIENELIPLVQENGLGLLTWPPLAHGMLVGVYSKEDEYPARSRATQGWFYSNRISVKGIEVGNKFVKLAKEADLTPAQLGVLWCKDQPGVTAPLVSPGSVKHLEDLIPVMEMTLDDSLRGACNNLVPPGSAVANFHNTAGWMKEQLV